MRDQNKLWARWSKRNRDWLITYPISCDGHLLYGVIAGYMKFPEFIEELEKRGYDTTTLSVSVKRKVA